MSNCVTRHEDACTGNSYANFRTNTPVLASPHKRARICFGTASFHTSIVDVESLPPGSLKGEWEQRDRSGRIAAAACRNRSATSSQRVIRLSGSSGSAPRDPPMWFFACRFTDHCKEWRLTTAGSNMRNSLAAGENEARADGSFERLKRIKQTFAFRLSVHRRM